MWVRVTKAFRDKHTKEVYQAGKVINIKRERFDEINENLPGYVVENAKKSKE